MVCPPKGPYIVMSV